jgi:hypothetical protein
VEAVIGISVKRERGTPGARLDQLTRAHVPQALGRAAAQPGQPVGADVILAQHLDNAPDWRVGVGDEVPERSARVTTEVFDGPPIDLMGERALWRPHVAGRRRRRPRSEHRLQRVTFYRELRYSNERRI